MYTEENNKFRPKLFEGLNHDAEKNKIFCLTLVQIISGILVTIFASITCFIGWYLLNNNYEAAAQCVFVVTNFLIIALLGGIIAKADRIIHNSAEELYLNYDYHEYSRKLYKNNALHVTHDILCFMPLFIIFGINSFCIFNYGVFFPLGLTTLSILLLVFSVVLIPYSSTTGHTEVKRAYDLFNSGK